MNNIRRQYGESVNKAKKNENPLVTELKSVVDKFTKEQLEDVVVSEKKLREVLANIKNNKDKLAEAKNHERILLDTIKRMKS